MAEKTLSFVFLLVSIGYVWAACDLSFGRMNAPKAGFLPVISGSIAIFLSAIIIGRLMLKKQIKAASQVNWRKLTVVVFGLLCYVALFVYIGYTATTFVILFYLLKVTEMPGWINPCLLSAGIAGSFYFIFAVLLGCNLP